MKQSRLLTMALVVLAAACSDDVTGPTPAELEPLCGQDGPVRILDLEPGELPIAWMNQSVFGDRFVLSIRHDVELGEADTDVWSVGMCGEDPRLLASMVDRAIEFPPFLDVPMICEGNGNVLALDPTGALPANQVFEGRDCSFHGLWTQQGLVSILGEGDTGPLVLQPWPSDPLTESSQPIVLLDEVKAAALPSPHTFPEEYEVLATVGDEAFAITSSDELVAISLETFTVSVLASNVREFEVGASGRWIVWQSTESTNDNPDWPTGPIFVLDRGSGEVTQIDDTALAFTIPSTMTLEPMGVLHYRDGGWSEGTVDHFVDLETMTELEITTSFQPIRPLDDGRALLGPFLRPSPLVLFDRSSGSLETLYDGEAFTWRARGDHMLLITAENGELLRLGYDGSSELLARHARRRYFVASDDRVVTSYGVLDEIGQVIVVDPDTLDDRTIDTDVHEYSTNVYEPSPGELLVSYFVVDADPERFGVWLAKPAG